MATPNHILSGIYKITNIASGKVYVGSAVNITFRWTVHRSDLRGLQHHSSKLQRAWNKYGPDAFEFSVIEYVSEKENLIEREQHWMDELRAASAGYNMRPSARSNLGLKASDETKARMSAALKGKVKSPEARAKIAEAIRQLSLRPEVKERLRNAQLGKKASAETKAKMSAAQIGRKRPPELMQRIGEAQRGKVLSEETKAKISAAKKGRKLTPEHVAKIAAGNKGKTISPEQRALLSKAHTGKKLSDATKAKITAFLTGRKWKQESIAKREATNAKNRAEKARQRLNADANGQLYLSFM